MIGVTTFDVLRRCWPDFPGPALLAAFTTLSKREQDACWADLADICRRENEEAWLYERQLGEEPPPKQVPRRASTSPTRAGTITYRDGSDPLLEIEPADYIGELLGVDTVPGGKVACPFHDDRTPSLHVYRSAERGWYCHGCGRGGDIYNFAADLAGVDTRGSEFVALRETLKGRFA